MTGGKWVAIHDSVFYLANFDIDVLTNHDFDDSALGLGHDTKCTRCGVSACLKTTGGESRIEYTPVVEHGSISNCLFTWKNPYWRENLAALEHACEVLWTMALWEKLKFGPHAFVSGRWVSIDNDPDNGWEAYVNDSLRVNGRGYDSFNAAFTALVEYIKAIEAKP